MSMAAVAVRNMRKKQKNKAAVQQNSNILLKAVITTPNVVEIDIDTKQLPKPVEVTWKVKAENKEFACNFKGTFKSNKKV